MENSTAKPISTLHTIFIGVLGSLCLIMIKLIQNKFFINNYTSDDALFCFYSYGCYLFFGAIAAYFFTENISIDAYKKNAFLCGFTAPTLLLAFVSGHDINFEKFQTTKPDQIKKISIFDSLMMNEAYADELSNNSSKNYNIDSNNYLIRFNKNDIIKDFSEKFFDAITNKQKKNYIVILGEVSSVKDGMKNIFEVEKILKREKIISEFMHNKIKIMNYFDHDELKVNIVIFTDIQKKYIAINGMTDYNSAKKTLDTITYIAKAEINSNIMNFSSSMLDLKDKTYNIDIGGAKLLGGGVILDARNLYE